MKTIFPNFLLAIFPNSFYYTDKMKNNKESHLFVIFLLFLSGCLVKRDILHDPHFYYDKKNYTLIRVNPETRDEDIKEYLNRKSTVKTMSFSPPVERPKDLKGYDTPPKPKKIIKPIYPREALYEGYHGTLVLKMLLDSTGNVLIAMPIDIEKTKNLDRGGILLVESALEALMKSEFEPAIHNGKPVRVWVSFPVRFILNYQEKKGFPPNLVP